MNLGRQVRLNRLFSHPSGRLCSVAVDHFIGDQQGLPAGLKDLRATLAQVVEAGPDAVIMHKGVAKSCWQPYAGQVPLIIQSIIGRPDDTANEELATPEDAVRLGADAFAATVFVYGRTEAAQLRRLADQVRAAEQLGMPVIVHIYPRRFSDDGSVSISHEPDDVAWAVRCGVEVGVDVVKTPYTGDVDSFREIVATCPVPIVAAGGPQTATFEEALTLVAEVVQAGARGVTVGRNVWGVPDIAGAVRALKQVVHGGECAAPDAMVCCPKDEGQHR